MKLWQKNKDALQSVNAFTVGKDREMDLALARYDVLGSLAHVQMLSTVGLLSDEEAKFLKKELKRIHGEIARGDFRLDAEVEDIHSQVELMLTNSLGDAGKKIHSARSRNDQVLLDIKLFLRGEIRMLVEQTFSFFELLQEQSEKYREHYFPGYTHLQLAMPSSFGLWFGAYSESLVDDLLTIQAAHRIVNKNPLGSAAGYGSSFPINRQLTTELLGFAEMNVNVVYAQMGRGKVERVVAQSLANLADTLSKISMDACLYLNPGFGFIRFPEELTTGSSIMPHKKNPDVFEIIRGKCNRLRALPNEIIMMTTNLPSGYHRDLQLLKEHLFPAFTELRECLEMATLLLSQVQVEKDILSSEQYKFLFSVEEVNRLVNEGVPFRDAYRQVGRQIEEGKFQPSGELKHTHEGSLGNLSNDRIRQQMTAVLSGFPFDSIRTAEDNLLHPDF
jgi:argininosuccinate lyase